MDYSKSPLRSCVEVLPADFLSVDWHQEVGCLLNKADVNMSSEEKGGNIPQIGARSMCQGSADKKTKLHTWIGCTDADAHDKGNE